jgi:uncharacterized protein YqeY
MSLMEQIKSDQLAARKGGVTEVHKASLLTTLLGEATMVGKNAGRETTDQEVVAVVKKFIKNVDETISALTARNQDASAYMAERSILEFYLPMQLSEDALRQVAECQKDMPSFMKHLKENFAGKYDGKLASTVAKSVFN